MSSTPPPSTQRRSRPVNGSVLALLVVVGVEVVLVGEVSPLGVVFSEVDFSSLVGDVPVDGVGVEGVDGVGVGVVWL